MSPNNEIQCGKIAGNPNQSIISQNLRVNAAPSPFFRKSLGQHLNKLSLLAGIEQEMKLK